MLTPYCLSADPFLRKGGAWEGFVFILVLVMMIIATDVGYWFAAVMIDAGDAY